ncbi:S8 family serine peptidase [Streptomyces sp. NBC_00102]|uniref:S8 family serine peptidase n=1 Tax=Streptomyces sp. NBC_00102 TaxID=2975652 RepID=UPI0022554B8F|nr:S8 family serine peptidase [Streptomyces sp. NBC_00102]MCX5400475.1 S8 family serine peptidase [Streptomyces sp. NBC_00102]
MRRATSRTVRRCLSVTAVVALTVGPLLATPSAMAADGVELPVLAGPLADGDTCAKASGQRAETTPWTLTTLQLPRTWRLTEGEGVTVAVVDTGVGGNIPALRGRVTALGAAGYDCVGHGSFAAGVIAAAPVDGSGFVGVAPKARVLAIRGTDERGTPDADLVASGIRTAVDQGSEVVYVANALLAGRAQLTSAVEYAASHDVVVVAPAAPDTAPEDPDSGAADTTARPYFPAFVAQALSVSDYGPDGTRPEKAPEPFAADMAAPGDTVVGTGPSGGGHYIGTGSSLAAAHAAGAAVLVRARYPELTAAEVVDRLQSTAYPAVPPRLDPYAAVSVLLPGTRVRAATPPAAHVVPSASADSGRRAVVIAVIGGVLVVLLAAAAVVVPRGRARGWRPAGG